MPLPSTSHDEPGLSPLEVARLQRELQQANADLAAANAVLRENEQRLEQRVAERTRELATLLEVSRTVTSTLELKPLLGVILDQLQNVVGYRLAALCAVEGDDMVLVEQRGADTPILPTRGSLRDHPNTHKMLLTGQPIIIPDLNADTYSAGRVRGNIIKAGHQAVYADSISWLSVPLIAHERAIGELELTHPERNYFTPARVELVMAFASYAAVAIENARLYQQAQQLAALEERQKLARDLHDSVSQALYGIALGARTARAQLERDVTQVAEPLEYVLSLADAGLAEMRALIFELRPESLQTEGLIAALTKQADALRVRHRLAVRTTFGPEPEMALNAKEALYRIAQEALHNIAKHAKATQVEVKLETTVEDVRLEISDNGVGFDPQGDYPGHLGLRSMRERVEKLGGSLLVASTVGQGARLVVHI